jgi:hypothetical protein
MDVVTNIPKGLEKTADPVFERHFSPEELGQVWGLSADTVRRLFETEPGVMVIERAKARARRYRTMRIPESVALRVHRRMTNPVAMLNR